MKKIFKERIDALRRCLSQQGLSAIVIPSNDPHFGEYVPDYYKTIEWLTGFTGESATLVVTLDDAALWLDSRFFVSGAAELEGTGVRMMKLKVEGTPSITGWLSETLSCGDSVALDKDLFTYNEYLSYTQALPTLCITLIDDVFGTVRSDRPARVFNAVTVLDESVTGESVRSKHARIVEKIGSASRFAYIITSLDESAWLLNIRGTDIEYNPLAQCYTVVTADSVDLFANLEGISQKGREQLEGQGVVLHRYDEFELFLTNLPASYDRIFSSGRISSRNYLAAMTCGKIHPDTSLCSTVAMMKAVKNPVEIEGFRKAYLEDAKAQTKLYRWIYDNIENHITEYDVVRKLIEFRSESPDYLGESFQPIVAYGANAAQPHYAPTEMCHSEIKPEGFLLIDSGGQYTYGTTDTTRTLPVGPLTQEQIDDYTAVLKGMIDLSMAKFCKGTRGAQLDILARGPVMARGKMYWHGTGHGIGSHLCVHEGPQSIRMEENPVALLPGMVISNEPAIYVEGGYGIRHENTILVKPDMTNRYGEFYAFDTVTLLPFDMSAVNFDMLDQFEISWLEEFNSRLANLR
ncbi:MAG: M24 family metallopeptidase [Candidatus Coprenecus sp.]